MCNLQTVRTFTVLACLFLTACVSTRPPAGKPATLTNTYWKLTLLDGTPVIKGKAQTESHFILHADGERIGGSGGCNRLAGTYRIVERKLLLSGIAVTRMACKVGMQQEQEYLQALGKVTGWRIDGQKLVLLDTGGLAVANFESVYTR